MVGVQEVVRGLGVGGPGCNRGLGWGSSGVVVTRRWWVSRGWEV